MSASTTLLATMQTPTSQSRSRCGVRRLPGGDGRGCGEGGAQRVAAVSSPGPWTPQRPPQIHVLAGVNGAGKSSVVGATIRDKGGEYYNPDEAARAILATNPGLGQTEANAVAWEQGRRLLERAIDEGLDFTFETTLGGNTMPALLAEAAERGIEVHLFFVGLDSPDAHIERVRHRVRGGGHDIPEAAIRRRYRHSLINLYQCPP